MGDLGIMSRRGLLGSAVLGGAALAPAGGATGQYPARDFLLVHGGWRGGWCWRRVAERLAAQGHRVLTPTLTGLGERSHLLAPGVGLDTHVQDVLNVIRWERLEQVVLCGHSNGGAVITMVAEQSDAIASIVYLDAFTPEYGESIAALASPGIRAAIQAAIDRGDLALPPPPAAFFQVNERDRPLVDALCTPHPVQTFADVVSTTGARDRIARRTYVRCTGFASEAFDAARQRLGQIPGWKLHDLDCGHDAMLDLPDEVAALLLAAA